MQMRSITGRRRDRYPMTTKRPFAGYTQSKDKRIMCEKDRETQLNERLPRTQTHFSACAISSSISTSGEGRSYGAPHSCQSSRSHTHHSIQHTHIIIHQSFQSRTSPRRLYVQMKGSVQWPLRVPHLCGGEKHERHNTHARCPVRPQPFSEDRVVAGRRSVIAARVLHHFETRPLG